MFKQLKRLIKMGTLTLPLLTDATIEEKTNTWMDQRCPMYHLRLQIIQESLDSHTKAHHN